MERTINLEDPVVSREVRTAASSIPAGEGKSTIDFYESHAREYFDRTVSADLSQIYDKFLKYVKPGGRILDAGSGSGRDLRALRERGFDPTGIDASNTLAKLAADFSGTTCLPMDLENLRFDRKFDAAWACASLLHLPKRKLLAVLRRLYRVLSKDGVLFVSVQVGEGEQQLPDGRFFAYYAPDEFAQFLKRAGFFIDQSWTSEDSLQSPRSIRWLNIIAHRGNLAPSSAKR